MNVESIIVSGDQKINALIVHSTEDELGQKIAEKIKTIVNQNVGLMIYQAATYKELITIFENAGPYSVFVLIAHGDRKTNSAWLFDDIDEEGVELSLGVPEQATLKEYLKDKICVFGVCFFGVATLAKAIVGHDGAIFALTSKPQNKLTGLEVATAAASLLNAMESAKPSSVTLDELQRFCASKIPPAVLAPFEQLKP